MNNTDIPNKPLSVTTEPGKNAGEEQTELRRIKKKFVQNVRKNPELKHLDPEALWNSIDMRDLIKQRHFPYQRIKRQR